MKKKDFCLRVQWLWLVFLQLEASGDYASRFRGFARLGTCISASNEGLHAT